MKETTMKLSLKKWKPLLIALAALPLTSCQMQIVVTKGILSNWFWSRLIWALIISAFLGIVAARFLCSLPYKAPLMDCISAARTRFAWLVLLLVFIVTPFFLWVDAWITQPFGQDSDLGFLPILSVAILEWRTLAIMSVVAVMFYLAVAIFTRYIYERTCCCKHAFLPKFGN
jgi:hypothetical protein